MKRSFFLNSGRVDTVIWMHYTDANWTYGEKAWRQLHKEAASNIEQVLEATLHKAAAVQPLTTHLEKLDRPDIRDTAGEVGPNSLVTYSRGPLYKDVQSQDDQLEPTYNSSVALMTYRKWWSIEKGGGRESGRSVLAARHHDDDDDKQIT